MNRKLVLLLIAVLATPLFAETRQRYTITTNGALRSVAMRVAAHAASEPKLRVRTFRNLDGFAADLTEAEAEALRATPGVESVDPVVMRYASSVPMKVAANLDVYEGQQVTPWGVPIIRAMDVWPVTKGENVNVVVMDTGIDLQHPDLLHAYAGGYNVLNPAKPPMDDNFHGTHVAGTIAATNNGFGVVGIAPNVKLWAVKALDLEGKGRDEELAAGFDWITSKAKELGGRWVVNCSFGAQSEGGRLESQAVARAIEAGVIIIAAAGNNNLPTREYPARLPNVIAVGASGPDGKRASFSNYGTDVNFVAPGVEVQSTLLDGYLEEANVVLGNETFEAFGLKGSPRSTISGKIVDCKIGDVGDCPASVAGNIALIRRGSLDFRDKARNAKNAGATAVIIYDHQTSEPINWKLLSGGCPDEERCPPEWRNYQFPLTIGISKADGEKLLTKLNQSVRASYRFAQYGRLSGTSMATPHVVATAALLLSLDPTLSISEIARILRTTARDTAEEGWDFETGFGIVDALAAAQYVAPDKFSVPPPDASVRRRAVRP